MTNSFIDAVEKRKNELMVSAPPSLSSSDVWRQALTEVLAEAGPVAWMLEFDDESENVVTRDPNEVEMWKTLHANPYEVTPLFTAPPADERDASIAELEAKGNCSLSWNGFNLHGDATSIAEAKKMLHSHGIVPELKDSIKELRAQLAKASGELKEVGRSKDKDGSLVIHYAPKEELP